MAQNRLIITHEKDNTIRLGWYQGQMLPRLTSSVPFIHPFDEEGLANLRWYLEQYLRHPYGISPQKAEGIEQQLKSWGQALFELVFHQTDKGREFFQEATREGLDRCEVGIISDEPKILNLPWELLYCRDYQFIAPLLSGIYRSLNSHAVRAPMGNLPADKLNILLIIARPYGERDIGLRTIARPMLDSLKPISDRINLKVLRPPSFEQFEAELNAHREGFYHIVHFDGHGDFDTKDNGRQVQLGTNTPQGQLVFEAIDGSPQVINADRIAQSLANCRVPVFILNACKSAQEGEEKFSSVAARFIFSGAKGVVAMAYSVYADAVKVFMGRLYRELVNGRSLSESVAAGRLSVLNDNFRSSPKGKLPLQDWMVPVLYQQEPYTPFVPPQAGSFEDLMTSFPISRDIPPTPLNKGGNNLFDFPEEGAYGFIGRDYDILRLERAFRLTQFVVIKGMGGVGKTELSKGFAHWLAQTSGRKEIFFASFEDGKGLSYVITQIGRALGGEKFSQYLPEQQEAIVIQYLKTHPCLLIWDNFEPVAGFPTGNEPLLMEEEREQLKGFLKALRGHQTWVLITSRREERWLDIDYSLLEISGLLGEDAQELALSILRTVGVDPKKLSGEYVELLKLLGGHPLSLRVVLPHLKTQSPSQLIEALRGGFDAFEGKEEEGRDKSLTVSLDYSFTRLSPKAKKHLPFLAFFTERVYANWLHSFFGSSEDEFGQAYQAVFGENIQENDWLEILNEAVEAGILDYLGKTFYKIHPALPGYLRRQLESLGNPETIVELEKKLLFFYEGLASYYDEQLVGNAHVATSVIRFEEPNFLQYLRLAEQQQQWAEAQSILQPLGEIYQRMGRRPEFRSLRQRALKQIGYELAQAKAKGQDAFDFWMYLRGVDANEALMQAKLEEARTIYQSILDALIALNDASVNDKIATIYHQLGRVAEEQRRYDEAVAYYLKALKIKEDTGDWYYAAATYHQLGYVAQQQRHYEEAVAYYLKALKIFEDAQDWYNAATIYHQLGIVAYEQWHYEEAVAYYLKALKIFEDAQDWYNAAREYHQLGMVAQQQRHYDEAVDYYHKALKIFEDAEDWYKAAGEYHQLGRVAEEQRHYEDAVAYYLKALKIFEDAEDWYNAANDYHQLGMVAEEQRHYEEAISYYKKAVNVWFQYKDWYKASISLRQWGKVLEAIESYPEALRIYLQVLAIDFEHNQDWIGLDIKDLGRMTFNKVLLGLKRRRKIIIPLLAGAMSLLIYWLIKK